MGQKGARQGDLGGAVGHALGWLIAPAFGLVSFARQARTFHPRGPTYRAVVTKHERAPARFAPLAERLGGSALVRLSGALWKHAEDTLDVLGCAVRFRRDASDTAQPADDDQDLLFATIRRPWTMPFAPLTTNVRDYLGNDYFAVSPFDVGTHRPVYFRLHPLHPSPPSLTTRARKLARAVEHGYAIFNLEISERPFGPWKPLATVTLKGPSDVDGEALRFRPFRDGRGVHPRGFVHALRCAVYATSQAARP